MRNNFNESSFSQQRNDLCIIEFNILTMRIENELQASLIIDYGDYSFRLFQDSPILIEVSDLLNFTYRVLDQNSFDLDSGKASLVEKLIFFSEFQIINDSSFSFVFRLNGNRSNISLQVKFQLSIPKRREYAELRKRTRQIILSTKIEQGYRSNNPNSNSYLQEFNRVESINSYIGKPSYEIKLQESRGDTSARKNEREYVHMETNQLEPLLIEREDMVSEGCCQKTGNKIRCCWRGIKNIFTKNKKQ